MVNIFKGIGVALVTPFKTDRSVDFESLEAITEQVIAEGVDFICVLGTTAETPTLTLKEKREVMKTIVRVNNCRVPLMLGAGGNCTSTVCEYLQTEDLTGFQGVLIVAPYYNKPSQEGVYQHFKSVSDASPLPLILYNIPGRTGICIEPETVKRIVEDCHNVVAIKEASGKIEVAEKIMELLPQSFDVISGDDSLTYALMQKGAVGVISVVANAFARKFRDFIEKNKGNDAEFAEIISLTMADGNPAGIKCMLHAQNKCENVLRLPLVPVCDDVRNKIFDHLLSK